MSHFPADELLQRLEAHDGDHIEIFETESMTVEMGRHEAGTAAPKNPHNEDELYYIVSGTGKVRVGDDVHAVESGDLVHVEPGVEHDFFDIEEEIQVLIVFAGSENPASYSVRE